LSTYDVVVGAFFVPFGLSSKDAVIGSSNICVG